MERERSSTGSLTIVGTGIAIAGQVTLEAYSAMKEAEVLYYLVTNAVSAHWLEEINPNSLSLFDCYEVGRDRRHTYEEMVDRIMESVKNGRRVVAAFYGHPGVFADPAHEAIRRARREGYQAQMLPGVSAEDCLIADLGIDPGACGFQMHEATDFLLRQRQYDVSSYLILWQIGGIGVGDFRREALWNREGVQVLAEELQRNYPAQHEVTIYEASPFPVVPFKALRVPLSEIAAAAITVRSTLCIPPIELKAANSTMRARLRV